MTYRDRRERRIERLEEWAGKREAKAEALTAQNAPYVGDNAFATQPGRIPERERANARDRKAHEHTLKATEMAGKADGIRAALDRAIYDDDPDAIEALGERIEVLEAERARIKAYNATARKGTPDVTLLTEKEQKELQGALRFQPERMGAVFPAYVLTNLGGNINRNKKRVVEIRRRQEQAAKAEAAGGVVVEPHGEFVAITFADKPEREVIQELKEAGFWWAGGHWNGKIADMPEQFKL